ncbi:DNA repair protein RecN (Recombination protein N) [Sphingobium sp. B2D3A]|uniref:DNA repair protein RecN n=1 Tax=unclassified Sphingobium TaxID=2611147 RepID=UPI0022244FF5|nr:MULTISPECIES: DNA repair protein RecN [unclassified Sphingobium]MCW2337297.1 DNA repair protein RecN (Recombination protein N) [Sphingobium sp. B2D3A]MCW2381149.1 DNA repair protein RecN (Recombination protein N) [Sphingobium sp. B2D3B]MCW2383755.1 DNA repair protein RecN (Recombination protein N) [Sphingobium sp. B2D3D]MCW2398744.1 DNA repair protein RecN (Recombination protein N) [Sphingobium sp. B2D3C]
MLTGLSIRNIVLIEALDLVFERGLTVLTGETGAGKSILLDALGLALGMRADSGLVRAGADQASVTATFDPPAPGSALAILLAESDVAQEPGEPLLIRRTLKADGGSRAFINDQPCSAALLRDVGGYLVEIHGQHDERGLINPRGHMDLLDAFGGLDAAAVRTAHGVWQAAQARLTEARETLESAARERDYLAHAVAELTAFAPEPGEEETLATERADMQKGARLTEDMAALDDLLGGSDGALAKLRQAARRLDRIGEEHELLAQALAAFDRAVIEASEAEEHLARAGEALSVDPARLDAIETRLFDLRALARKHQVAADDLADLAARMTDQLARIDAGEAGLADLERDVAAARQAYEAAAQALSDGRREAAARLDAAVAGELAPLKLDAARFRTDVEPLPEGQWRASGKDRVEFMISTNPGAPFAPLTKIASGGELSRFILSLKVALAAQGSAGTMIFDEIDRGVGGAVAGAIGERLARLSGGGQVIVVTHSPQVAARGAAHLLIAKSSQGTITRTGVHPLDDAERREEIARMLSGAEITNEARAQAERLLEGV